MAAIVLRSCPEERGMKDETLVVHSDPEILGGTPVFVGTRVPLRNLIDYLERGHSLDEFLDAFPSVSRQQAVAALEAAHEALTARARPAR
jgi:uncharacterized protein (DUF433 family)